MLIQDLKEEVLHSIANAAKHLGILDHTAYRNKCIRLEFEKMKSSCVGETVEEIIKKISDKHHLGEATIRDIIYQADEIIERMPKAKPIKKTTRRIEARRR